MGKIYDESDFMPTVAAPSAPEKKAPQLYDESEFAPTWEKPQSLGQDILHFPDTAGRYLTGVGGRLLQLPGDLLLTVISGQDPETPVEGEQHTAFQIGRQSVHESQKVWDWNRAVMSEDEAVTAGSGDKVLVNRFSKAIKEHDDAQVKWQQAMQKRGFAGTLGQQAAQVLGPTLETMATSVFGPVGTVAAFDYWTRQGYGDFLSNGLKRYGVDPASLSAKEIREIDAAAKQMAVLYAGVEFMEHAIPGAPGGKTIEKLTEKFPWMQTILGKALGRGVGESAEEGLQKGVQEVFDARIAGIIGDKLTAEQREKAPTVGGALWASLKEGVTAFPTIMLAFGAPGMMIDKVTDALKPKPVDVSQPEAVAQWAAKNPDLVLELVGKKVPSRKDFEEAGLPRMPVEDRSRFTDVLRAISEDHFKNFGPQASEPGAGAEFKPVGPGGTVDINGGVQPIPEAAAPVEGAVTGEEPPKATEAQADTITTDQETAATPQVEAPVPAAEETEFEDPDADEVAGAEGVPDVDADIEEEDDPEDETPVVPEKKPLPPADQFGSLSADDIDRIVADQEREEAAAVPAQPKDPDLPKVGKKGVKTKPIPAAAQVNEQPPPAAAPDRGPGAIIESAAKHGLEGFDEISKGLYEIFGGGKLGMGVPIDTDKYAKAKPHFQAALAKLAASGKDVGEFIRWATKTWGKEIVPYLKQFNIDLASQPAGSQDNHEGAIVDERPTGNNGKGESEAAPAPGGGTAPAGSPVEAVPAESSGEGHSDPRSDSDVLSTESNAGSGVQGDEVPVGPVGVEGQRAPDTIGGSGAGGGGHGVVPVATVSGHDAASGAEQSVVEPPKGGNLDLRGRTPVRLGKSRRREVNAQAKEILTKSPDAITDEDREILRQYTGEGGLSSGTQEALNQHYTDYETIRAIFKALRDAGVKLKNLLEPAVGAGNFVGHAPDANWTTVDIDETNHKVVSALYPKAKHYNISFEEFTTGGFDAIISNVPFLETRGGGRSLARPDIKNLHDFYFAHALDRVKDDGVIAFITSTGTMDKLDPTIRKEIVSKADIIGAFRLPGGHFAANAHTDVITDIIFMQKRPAGVAARPEAKERNDSFVNSTKTVDDVAINEWYQVHPQAVLGTLALGKNKLYGGRPAYEVNGPARLGDIAITYNPYGKAEREQSKGEIPAIKAPTDSKQFIKWADENGLHYRMSDSQKYAENIEIIDGVVYALDQEVEFEDIKRSAKVFAPVPGDMAAKILALDAIRKLANDYQAGREEAASDADIAVEQYKQAFTKAPHADRPLKSFFKKNNETGYFAELTSAFDESFVLADVFRTKTRHEGSGRVRASKDDDLRTQAIAAEDNRGSIRFPTDQGFITEADIPDLLESGYALAGYEKGEKPTITIQNDVLYYSGNVYQKIEAVKRMRSVVPAEYRAALDKQEAALKDVMPVPKSVEEMHIKGSESWLEPFLGRVNAGISTRINEDGIKEYEVLPHRLFEADEANFFERHMNNHVLVTQDKDQSMGSYMRELREAEIVLHTAIGKLKRALADDNRIRDEVEYAFNSRFRNYVKPNYEKATYLIQDVLDEIAKNAPMTKDPRTGKMVPLTLRRNQVSWAIQALYEGRGINAHDVGGGKTMAAIVLARALKKRGRAQKPMFVVPAKTIKKWVRETKMLFPDAKVVDLGNLPLGKRQKALFDLANSNADYVYISHEGFEQIKLPVEEEARYAQDAMNEHVDDPTASGRQEALLVQKMDTYLTALKNAKRDTRLTWDKLGIDAVIADEAHNFKNIGINNQLVRFGLGTAFGFNEAGTALDSNRSYDFRFKANYTTERNNGGNVFLLTATPTPNKPMEIYTMLRHFGTNVFEEYGIRNDRDFANTFLSLGTVNDPSKGRAKSILRAIVNAQDLRGLLNRFVDKMSMEEMPWIAVPQAKEARKVLDQSAGYAEVAQDLLSRKQHLPKPAMKGDDTLVAIYTGGRNASTDPRLYSGRHAHVTVNARSYDSSDDKIQWVIDRVAEKFTANPNGGQLIFLDNSGHKLVEDGVLSQDVHAEIKSELMARGMDPKQVAIINGKKITNLNGKEIGAGNTADQKKADIQEAYNNGDIKVLIGSTASMGEGMDLQVKTTDIYHLDIPYTPGAIRQRNGRGVRPGNENETVNVHYLLMRGTFDSTSLNIVMTKRGWNEAIWDKEVADTISTEEEMTGGAISNDKQILIDLEPDPLRRQQLIVQFTLESMQNQAESMRSEVSALEGQAHAKERRIGLLEATLAWRRKHLEELKPDEKIKDETKRREQYDKSLAYAQKMLEVPVRQIKEERDGIKTLTEKAALAKGQLASLYEDIKVYYDRWFDDQGDSKVTADDVSSSIDDDDSVSFAPRAAFSSLRQPGTDEGTPTQAGEIVSQVKRLWPKLTIRGAATFKRRARGWYSRALGEMRTNDARDIDAITHELGHHFDRELEGWSGKRGLPTGIPAELANLGKDLYGTTAPKGGYRSEGFAEFIRGFLTGEDMTIRAPRLHRWFTTEYLIENRDEAKKLRKLEDTITNYRTQKPEQLVRAFRKPLNNDWSRDRMASAVDVLEAAHRDQNIPLLRAMQAAGIDTRRLPPSMDPYMLATFYSRSAGGRVRHAVMDETTNLYGQRTGDGLRAALGPVAAKGADAVEDWKDYAIARRAIDLHGRGINPGISMEDAEATRAKYDSPEFSQALDDVTAWSRRLLHLLVDTGNMTQAEFDAIEAANPVYVPFARQFAAGEIRDGRKRPGRAVYKIKGDGREIHDPLDAMIIQAEKIQQVAMQADVARAMVKLYDSQKGKAPALAKFLSEVPAPKEATNFTAEMIKKEMADVAVNRLGADPASVAAAMLDKWTERITVFTKAAEYHGKDNVFAVLINGQRRFFQAEPPLMEIMTGLTKEKILPGKLGEWSRNIVSLQRLGATGLNPAFGLLRNTLRDTLTASITADYHFHIPLVSTIQGMVLDIMGVESSKLYHALALDISGYVGQDMKNAASMGRRAMASTRWQKVKSVGAISGLREILSHSEVGPRLMEFRGAYTHGLKKWKNSQDAAILAGCAAKDITVNFSRAGSVGRAINECTLFYNAGIQSADKFARTLGIWEAAPWAKSGSRSKTLLRTAAKAAIFLTAAAVANYLRNRDDDWWKKLPPHEKWGYIHIKGPEGTRIARIPLPFEPGFVFGALPVAMLEESRAPGAFMEALKLAFAQVSPLELGSIHGLFRNLSALAPVADIAFNKDWKDSSIVPETTARYRVAADQFKPDTTWLAKQIGKRIPGGFSPAKIDHLIDGYTGGLYRRVMWGIENAVDPSAVGADGDFSTLPLLGTLFLRPGTSRATNDFYDRLDDLRKRKGSRIASLEEVGELAEAERVNRDLQDVWAKRREVVASGNRAIDVKHESDTLMKEVQSAIDAHQAEDKEAFAKAGAASVIYAATAPAAEDRHREEAIRLLSKMSQEDRLEALRRAAIEHTKEGQKPSVAPFNDNGSYSAFGKRMLRMGSLFEE
jgi:hypothetical protein